MSTKIKAWLLIAYDVTSALDTKVNETGCCRRQTQGQVTSAWSGSYNEVYTRYNGG